MGVANDIIKKWPLEGSKTPPCALNKEHGEGVGVGKRPRGWLAVLFRPWTERLVSNRRGTRLHVRQFRGWPFRKYQLPNPHSQR